MSKTDLGNVTVQRIIAAVLCALFAVAVAVAGPVTAIATADACAQITPVSLDSSLRIHAGEAGEIRYFELEVPEPGLVALDVSTPGAAGGEARIGFADSICGAADESRPFWIERSARHLTFFSRRQDTYFFRVAAQDPRQPPGALKVSVEFVALADLGGDVNKEEDDGVFEIDPDAKAGDPEKEEDDGVFEIDPDADLVFDADPFAAGILPQRLCRSVADDHGDTPGCATPYTPGRGELSGQIGNVWGDDEDYFAFRVTGLQTMRMTTVGGTDTHGSLYDRRGHRLAADDDGGDEANFRIVKTLSPGLYFLGVEGRGSAEGPYRLRVDTVPW